MRDLQVKNAPWKLKNPVLCDAAWKLCPSSVQLLLENGARMDADQPLHYLQHFMIAEGGVSFSEMLQRNVEIVKVLVQHGGYLDMTIPEGCIAFHKLLDPMSEDQKDENVTDVAKTILKLLFQENALLLPVEFGSRVPVFRLYDYWRGYPNVAYGYLLLEFGYTIEATRDIYSSTHGIGSVICSQGVRKLQSLTRTKLRKTLGCPLSEKLKNIMLPQVMKEYLCLKKIEDDLERWS